MRTYLYSFRQCTYGQKNHVMYLLCHLSFELPVDDDFLFSRELTIEKFNRDIFIVKVESPDVLLLCPIQITVSLCISKQLRFAEAI